MFARGSSASPARPGRLPWFVRSGVLAIGLGTASCRLPPIPAGEPSTMSPAADGAAVHGPAEPTSAIVREPAQLLPERTDLVVTVAGVQPLLRLIDQPRLLASYRRQYDFLVAKAEQGVGHNLWDPRTWPKIGVDPDEPLGAAMLDAHGSATCLFVTLSDPRRFREFFEAVGEKFEMRVDPVFEDRGVVLAHQPDASMALVLRDRFAFLVFNHRPGRASLELARELASIDPARGLAATPRWQKAVGAAAGRDLRAFVDLRAMTELEPEDGSSNVAQERGGRPTQGAWDVVLGSPGPLVIDLSLSATAVRGTVRARVEASGLLRRVLRAGGAAPLALQAMRDRLVFAAGASFDLAEGLAAADEFFRHAGGSLDAALAQLKATKGLDLRAVLDGQDGRASVAWSVQDPRTLTTARSLTDLTISAVLGLKDPAGQRAMFDALTTKSKSVPGFGGVTLHRTRAGGAMLTVPNWRSFHMAVVGSTLVLSTELEQLRRVERDGVVGTTQGLAPEVAALLTAPEAAAAVLVDSALPLGVSLRRPVAPESGLALAQPYERFAAVARAKIDVVPPSGPYKAKLKEWRQVQRADEDRLRRAAGSVMALAESLGVLAFNVREVGDELVLEVGQFLGPDGAVGALVAAAELRALEVEDALHEERLRIEQELRERRVHDIERALGVAAAP